MTNKLPIMPMFVDDYLADTKDFTLEEHGLYCLLLFHMWRNGGSITYDETRIARMLGADRNALRIAMRIVSPLLESHVDSNGNTILSQKRLSKEIKYTRALKAKQSLAGRKAAAIKWAKYHDDTANRNANRTPNRTPNRYANPLPPLRKKDITSSLQVAAREDSPDESGPAHDADKKPAEDKSYLTETNFIKRAARKDS